MLDSNFVIGFGNLVIGGGGGQEVHPCTEIISFHGFNIRIIVSEKYFLEGCISLPWYSNLYKLSI